MTYYADPQTQLQGQPSQQHDCGLTVGSQLADTSSLGYYRPTPAKLRAASGVPNYSGTTYPQIINAVLKVTGVVLTALYWVAKAALDAALAAKRGVGIMINCSVTINTPYHTGTFTGLHEIFIAPGGHRVYNGVEQYLVNDPGDGKAYQKYEWWPAALVIKAAKAATSNSTLILLQTRDLTNVSRKVVSTGPIRATATATGRIIGQVVVGTMVTVVDTLKGGAWSAPRGSAYGWNTLGPGKFVAGLRVR